MNQQWAHHNKSFFDPKALAFGLAGVALCIFLLVIYIVFQGPAIVRSQEEALAYHVASIENNVKIPHVIPNQPVLREPPVETGHGEAHHSPDAHDTSPPGKSNNIKPLIKTDRLSAAPDPNIVENTTKGPLPIISATGQTSFLTYKKPFFDDIKNSVISIAVLDYGLSENVSRNLLDALPSEVTMIITPYSPDADHWQKKARENGHELWLHVPFQNAHYPEHDYGPNTLLARSSLQYNQDRLVDTLSSTTGYTGVAIEADNLFVAARPMLQNLLQNMFSRGLGYFELNPDGPLYIESFAMDRSAPYVRNGYQIDGTKKAIQTKLEDLEFKAKEKGHAIGYIVATPASVPVLHEWIKSLSKDEFTLAPLSYITVLQNQRPNPLNIKPLEQHMDKEHGALDVQEVDAVPVHHDNNYNQ